MDKLADVEATSVLDLDEFWTREIVFEQAFGELLEENNWTVLEASASYDWSKGPVRLTPSGSNPRLLGQVDLDSSGIHEVRVDIGAVDPGRGNKIALFWARNDEPLSGERMIQLSAKGPGRKTVVFDVASHPEWSGQIKQLRLDPTYLADDSVILRSLQAVRRSTQEDSIAKALSQPWRIDFDTDIRNGFIAMPSTKQTFPVEPLEGSSLRFSYAMDSAQTGKITYRVEGIKSDGSRLRLFEDHIPPGSPKSGKWQEARIALEPVAGQQIQLEFSTVADDEFDTGAGFAYWADLELHQASSTPTPPNVVLIVIDTLRADHVSSYGYGRSTTPGLDTWVAQHGVRFDTVVASSPWTLPSHVSLFTGLDAVRHGINHPQVVPETTELLAETLAANGYRTVAFTGGGFVSSAYGIDRGFDRFDYWVDPIRETTRAGKDLEHGLENVHEWLRQGPPEPFFLFFHTYEVHATYLPRAPFFESFLEEGLKVDPGLRMGAHPDPPTAEDGWRFRAHFTKRTTVPKLRWSTAGEEDNKLLGALYDSGIAHTDRGVSNLLSALREQGLDERSLIVVTSDHGEGLGEKDTAGHYSLYDSTLLVPLMMSFPDGQGSGRSISTQVRLIDVYSSILDVVGIPEPLTPDGSSLLPLVKGNDVGFPKTAISYAASSNYGISIRHDSRSKLILNNSLWDFPEKQTELYNLDNDPLETDNLTSVDETITRLGDALRTRYESVGSFVRLDLSNDQAADLHFLIGGPGISPYRFKAFGPPGQESVSWKPGQATITLPPNSQTTLFVELPLTELTLGVGPESSSELVEKVNILEMRNRKQWSLGQDGAWLQSELAENGTWIRLSLQSPRGVVSATEATPPEEIQEQLKQLGYVN